MGYGLHNAEVYKTEHEKKKTFMNKKRTKHFVKYGSIEIHGAMSLSSRVETFSRVPTAFCFCVVWMCCDFQGLIAFHTLWDEGEDSIHCASLTQGQSAFLYYYILYYAEVLGGLPNANLLTSEKIHKSFIPTNMMAVSPSFTKNFMLYLLTIFYTLIPPPIFETIFYIQDLSSWGSSDQSL